MATYNLRRESGSQPISAIGVAGFKSINSPCKIEVRPLTILAGANSSGKSSIMQPLLLLKQTLEATYDPGSLLISGPNVQFTNAEQLLSVVRREPRTPSFTVSIQKGDGASMELRFDKSKERGFDVGRCKYRAGSEELLIEGKSILPDSARNRFLQRVRDFYEQLLPNGAKDHLPEDLDLVVTRERFFLRVLIAQESRRKPGAISALLNRIPFPLPVEPSLFDRDIRRVIHVPGLRGNPARNYKTTPIGPAYPGTFENYVASVVNDWRAKKDHRLVQLGKDLETLGLTWKVSAREIDDTQVEIRVGRLPHARQGGARDVVSIADVGFGVSQVLPVVVALLAATEGQVVFIEQPEIHLHPRAQHAMASVLADAAKRGVRVIAETHSSLLLLGVQSLVAKGELRSELVKLHWFIRDGKTGQTTIKSADLDAAGAFGPWPEDFADVSLGAHADYQDAAESKMMENLG